MRGREWGLEKIADLEDRAGLHNLRHTAISLLLNSGADPFAVQKLAGHSDVRLTTQTYAHVQAESLKRAAGVLDRVGLEGRDEGGEMPASPLTG